MLNVNGGIVKDILSILIEESNFQQASVPDLVDFAVRSFMISDNQDERYRLFLKLKRRLVDHEQFLKEIPGKAPVTVYQLKPQLKDAGM